MGRKEGSVQTPNLEVKVPTFFRCPISLDVMRSPVSLCTGVTYDRASIQRWIDSGNTTCPATMQSLPSTDLIPNLTLRRLINLWSATAAAAAAAAPVAERRLAANLVRDLRSSSDPVPLLRSLADFFLDADGDGFEKNGLVDSGGCAAGVSHVIVQNAGQIETLEAAARVLGLILASDWIEEKNKGVVAASLISDLNASVSALLSVLTESKMLESRADAARVLGAVLSSSDFDSRAYIAEKYSIVPELIRLVGDQMGRSAIDAGLECLEAISGSRRARLRLVQEGIVPAAVRALTADASLVPASTAQKALRLLEGASGTAEGRSVICNASAECLGAVLQRMMRVGREGMEAAVAVLWSVCHRFRDRRAVEAVLAEDGGMAKILLLMQSNCSPAVRQMSGDLLKISRLSPKSCIAAYDTKTKHIMPF